MKIVLQVFDLLYVNGKSLLRESLRVCQPVPLLCSVLYGRSVNAQKSVSYDKRDGIIIADSAGPSAPLLHPVGGIPHLR